MHRIASAQEVLVVDPPSAFKTILCWLKATLDRLELTREAMVTLSAHTLLFMAAVQIPIIIPTILRTHPSNRGTNHMTIMMTTDFLEAIV